MDHLQAEGDVENIIRSLSRFSEKVFLVLSGKTEVHASAQKISPSLIFERLWKELRIGKIIKGLLDGRKFEFDVERVIFLTVLHRLFASGSDRSCDKWHRDYRIDGVEPLVLHHHLSGHGLFGGGDGRPERERPLPLDVPERI